MPSPARAHTTARAIAVPSPARAITTGWALATALTIAAHRPSRHVDWLRTSPANRSSAVRCWVADIVAIVGAFVVLAQISSRSLQLTWVSVCGLLTLLLGAKILGLYDRDDVLLHKTTLDEAPKLFHMATLGALVAWLAGGFVVEGGTLNRREALLLWLVLMFLLVLVRSTARALALRIVPAERCLFIGDQASAKTIRSKLAGTRRRQGRVGGPPRSGRCRDLVR